MRVRLKDIAQDLGVSVVTVSKVLHNHADIGEETRQRVLKRVRELNYQPSYAARALVTGRTYTVALVVPDLVHPFFSEVAKSLAAALRPKGYSLLISSSDEDGELESREIESLMARELDAIVIAATQANSTIFRCLEAQGTPLVMIDREVKGVAASFVGIDDRAAGELATGHLASIGCTRIAHIRGPEVSTAAGRLAGYKRALTRRGHAFRKGYVPGVSGGDANSDARGGEAMRQLLRLHPRPDGVFCYNDPTALGAMNAILDAGLRVPEDIAVIGCGNVHYGPFLRVSLSSIDQRSADIAAAAAELVLEMIEEKQRQPPQRITLEPRLIVRASTSRPS